MPKRGLSAETIARFRAAHPQISDDLALSTMNGLQEIGSKTRGLDNLELARMLSVHLARNTDLSTEQLRALYQIFRPRDRLSVTTTRPNACEAVALGYIAVVTKGMK